MFCFIITIPAFVILAPISYWVGMGYAFGLFAPPETKTKFKEFEKDLAIAFSEQEDQKLFIKRT